MPPRAGALLLLLAGLVSACAGVTAGGGARAPVRLAAAGPLDDAQLGAVRGGFLLNDGTELRFAFQTATYVNGALVQRVVMPAVTVAGGPAGATATLSPNTAPAPAPFSALGGGGAAGTAPAAQVVGAGGPVVVPGVGGATSVLPVLGAGGITTLLANTANGQVVQQATRVDIALAGARGLAGGGAVLPFLPLMQAGAALPR